MKDNINPFNKDSKYEALFETLQRKTNVQDIMYQNARIATREQQTRRKDLEKEYRNLADPYCARATHIQFLLKNIDQEKKITENDIKRINAWRTAIFAESKFTYTPFP